MTLDQFILLEQLNLESFKLYALESEDLKDRYLSLGDWFEQYTDYTDSNMDSDSDSDSDSGS